MADGSLLFDTKLDISGIKSGLSAIGSVAGSATKLAAKGIAAVTGGLTTGAAAAVKVGSSFESSMSLVAATMGMTAEEIANGSEEFEKLKSAAKEAGATTQFSATQSAEALNYMALAGYTVDKAVQTLPTVLNLAATGGMDLATASDMVTDSMSALGDSAGTTESFVDKMAKTSQKSNTSVQQLGEAILTVGGTAKTLAGGVDEMNTILGIFADNGIKGAEGGTALRNVILSLSAPTDTARQKMEELGLEVFDAEGNMRPLNDVFNDLNDTLGTMTQGEQTQVLNEIFNKVDLKSVNALLANSGERFDELSGYIANCDGAAANMAETMNDNLNGKITTLKSALEGLGISVYEDMEEPLKDIVSVMNGYVNELSSAIQANGVKGLVTVLGTILADVISRAAEFTPQIVSLAVSLIQAFVLGLESNLPAILFGASMILLSLGEGILNTLSILAPIALQIILELVTTFIQMLPQILQTGIQMLVELALGLAQAIPQLIPTIVDVVLQMVETLLDNIDMLVDAAIQLIIGLAEGIIKALPLLIEKAPIIIEKLLFAIIRNAPEIVKGAIELVTKLAEGIVKNIPILLKQIPKLITTIVEGFIGALGAVVKIGVYIVQGIWDGITSAKDWLIKNVKNLGKSIIDAAKSALGIHSPSREFAYIGKMCIEGFDQEFDDFDPYDSMNVAMKANKATLSMSYRAGIEKEFGTSGAFDYYRFAEIMIDAFGNSGMTVTLDGRTTGRLIGRYL